MLRKEVSIRKCSHIAKNDFKNRLVFYGHGFYKEATKCIYPHKYLMRKLN
jgi:hypothetical protein